MPLPPRVVPDAGLVEVADRVWVARHGYLDVNVTVVAGAAGLLVVDTLWSAAAGRSLLEGVRRLGRGDPVTVVNTHHHFDHVLGNAAVPDDVPVLAHDEAAAALARHVVEVQRQVTDDPHGAEIAASGVRGPDRTLSSVTAVDLGGRVVEVVHPGRGHTAGDVVVRVPDAGVLAVGDLVEEGAPPSYGTDSWPLEWPGTLDLVLQLLGTDGAALVVPGHGAPVDRDHVEQQRDAIATVAETVRELARRGVPVDRALAQGAADGSWPWPEERVAEAVRRGYAQLPRSARQLPRA